MARVYINRHVVASNQKTGERQPPITIFRKGRAFPATSVEIIGEARIVYSPEKPLSNGARIWIECDEPHCRVIKKS